MWGGRVGQPGHLRRGDPSLTSLGAPTPATAAPVIRRGTGFALAALCTLLFLTFLDNTVVSVALGDVQASLGAGVQSLQWVVNGYALVFASVMLAAGAIGDEFGHRKVMLAGAGVFCAGSVICAVAPSSAVLIGGRAVMGLGAAGSEPGTLSMLRHVYPDRRQRARATGVWAAVSGLALALGPVIGGVLVGLGGWRWIFWFNLILGVGALVVGAVLLPETSNPHAHRVDTAGALLGASMLALFVFAVINGETAGFASASVLTLFACSALACAAFVWWQRRARHPLLELGYLHNRTATTSNVVAFAAYFGTFAIFFFSALYLRVVVGFSGYRIAAQFLPMMVVMIAASVFSGRWTARVGARIPVVSGCLLFGAGLLLTDQYLNSDPAYLPLAIALADAGAGVGVTIAPTTFAATSAVRPERVGMASSTVNTSREIGAVLGTAVLGAIVNAQLTGHLTDELRRLGVPTNFQGIVIDAVEHGGLPNSGQTAAAVNQYGSLVNKVIDAAYDAFYAGLHAALLVSAIVVLCAAVVAAVGFGRTPSTPPQAASSE
jgi:EmrB/QacA subfamily drug resistance transporter